MELLQSKLLLPVMPSGRSVQILVASLSNGSSRMASIRCAAELRESNVSVELIFRDCRLKHALKFANRLAAGTVFCSSLI